MGTTAEKLQKIINTKKALQTSINNKGGAITDNTPFDQYPLAVDNLSTPIYWDGIYIEEELVSGYTLTLNVDSDLLNSDDFTYSLDSGSTWNQFTNATMTLTNVEHIMFKEEDVWADSSWLQIGTALYGGDYIGDSLGNNGTSSDIPVTEDTTWYVWYGGGGT